MDEYSRENLALEVAREKGADVVEVLDRLVEERGAPEYIRCDNGPESCVRIEKRDSRIQAVRGRTRTSRS